jgi:adenosylmethionine-8-amino-7-oxononanoate aminotransferase
MKREVRGHGYLLGVKYVDPRDGQSFLPPELGVAGRIDDAALERGLVTLSMQPTGDGYAGDQSLSAPPFTTTDEEIAAMVDRFTTAVRQVASDVSSQLVCDTAPLAVAARER